MGVSGSGKSTVGALLAKRLGWVFEDGDRFHPAVNIEKMRQGIALTDDDRWPWLAAISARMDDLQSEGIHAVIACSSLKRSYRDVLIGMRSGIRLLYLKGDERLIAQRLAARHAHFMPSGLLHSQFEGLEEPTSDENPIVMPVAMSPSDIVARALQTLNHRQTSGTRAD